MKNKTRWSVWVLLAVLAALLFASCRGNESTDRSGQDQLSENPSNQEQMNKAEPDNQEENASESAGDLSIAKPDGAVSLPLMPSGAGVSGQKPDDNIESEEMGKQTQEVSDREEIPFQQEKPEKDGTEAEVSGNGAAEPRPEQKSEPVLWTDPLMEELIRQTLEKPEGDIYPEELLTIESLVYEAGAEQEYNMSIDDLEGLTNLKSLVIRSAGVVDITVLQKLTQLEDLDLGDNRITDIAPLAGLTGLRSLYLDYNTVSDITPLTRLTQLEVLVLDGNLITDVTPLKGLVELNGLYLADNHIEEISELAPLVELEELDVSGNLIEDYSVTSFFLKLEQLIVD